MEIVVRVGKHQISLIFFNIYLQAQCWPNCVKILGEWFPERVRNSVFGMFGTCAFGGGIIGTALAVSMNFVI